MSKKILIIHATAGAGHTKAAQAIQRAFGEFENGLEVKIINSLDYTTPFFRLTYPKIYVFLVNRIPLVWGLFYYLLDNAFFYALVSWIRHLNNWIASQGLVKFLKEYRPDVIIATHFLAPDVISMMGKDKLKARLITVVTDYRLHSFWLAKGVDDYIVAYDETKRDLIKRGVAADKIHILGNPIDSVFSEKLDKEEIRKRFHLDGRRFTVLVGCGGYGIGPVEKLIAAINGTNVPLELLVVCGKNEELYSKVQNLAKSMNFYLVNFGFVDNMHELMEVSDLLVTKPGGIVCAEALAKGLPIIGIFPIPGQERRNLDTLVRRGAAARLRNTDDIRNIIEKFYRHKDSLQRMKERIASIKRPQAALDIAKLAAELVKKSSA